MQKLKRCPFCGSADIDRHGWYDGQGQRGPECLECGATARDADAWNRRAPPEGMALVPREITAETGHKAGMIGDFKEPLQVECSQCDPDDPYSKCDECGGLFFYRQEVPVSWTTIKAIHKRIVELSERNPS